MLPESSHSSWLTGAALKHLVSELLADRTPARQHRLRRAAAPGRLLRLIARAIVRETSDLADSLRRQRVAVFHGQPRFTTSRNLMVSDSRWNRTFFLQARWYAIAVGTRPAARHRVSRTEPGQSLEDLFCSSVLPEFIRVLGGDAFGGGLAALLSLAGVSTQFLEREPHDAVMLELARSAGVDIAAREVDLDQSTAHRIGAPAEPHIVDCRRAVGFTRDLNLSAIGVEPDENGLLWCSRSFETWCPGVFGLGDVVGFSPETAIRAADQAERIHRHILRARSLRPTMFSRPGGPSSDTSRLHPDASAGQEPAAAR